MTSLDSNRLIATFADFHKAGKKALLPFITAGYPDLKATEALLKSIEGAGARICELGIPFSDPIADGPVIQNSYTYALENGITSEAIQKTVRRYRDGGGKLALVAMVSYSIVFRHDVEKYLTSLQEAGFDGLIVPDLPLEEAGRLESLASGCGLANVMLIAPNTPPDRQARIAAHSRGFVYFISIAGITGERVKLPEQTISAVGELRKHTSTPICVGFGISNPQTVKHVCEVADGAIVGSAIVHRIEDAVASKLPLGKTAEQIGRFVGELLEPIH